MKPIYVCEYCHMPIKNNEPTRVDRGKFFHTHRDCHAAWIAKEQREEQRLLDSVAERGLE